MIRIGCITNLNFKDGSAQITYDDRDETTAELAFLCPSLQYAMPNVGDQVLVAHLANGSSAGVILGPVWHDEHRPADGREDFYSRELTNKINGKARETYDAKAEQYQKTIAGTMTISPSKTWTLSVGGAVIKVDDSGAVNINAPGGLTITGNAKISGQLDVSGSVKFGSGSNGGNALISGSMKVTGDVEAGEISLQEHTHQGVHGKTSKAN